MLRLDLDTEPGGVTTRWRTGEGLSLHRRDGSLIMKIHAPYADERSVVTAAHALNFMFKSLKHAKARADGSDTGSDRGDGAQA
jgi:hypothetical protein